MRNKSLWTLAGAATLLIAWQLLAVIMGSALILPAPFPVLSRLVGLASTPRFLEAALFSFLRVLSALLLALPAASAVGVAAGLDPRARAFLRPLFSVVGATPVLSVILIALLWFGQDRTPIFTAFLMIFPVMAANATEGVLSVDAGLSEMALSYRLSWKTRLWHLYIPTLSPFLFAGARSSLSLAWKVVVAAEVLSQPRFALGSGMQAAKAQLETTDLFAWTAATVLLAGLCEAVLVFLRRRFSRGASPYSNGFGRIVIGRGTADGAAADKAALK